MSQSKQASSQAAWTLIMEGVTSARLETHRLRHMVQRALKLAEASKEKDHIHQVAGDLIQAFPARMNALEIDLDRTLLALADMGQDFLKARLPFEDKALIDEALEGVPVMKPEVIKDEAAMQKSAKRVATKVMLEMRNMAMTQRIDLECNADAANSIMDMLTYMRQCGDQGHTASLADTDQNYAICEFDGDGRSRIGEIHWNGTPIVGRD